MEIISVKIQQNGWLLNGTMGVPDAPGNIEREAIIKWLEEGNTPEPEFTPEELDFQKISKEIEEAKKYLNNTDYKDLPSYEPKVDEDLEVIRLKRKEARDFIRANS